MQTFSSETLPAATRLSAWNALYSRQLNNVEFTPASGQKFAAHLSMGQLGPIQFARMSTNRTQIQRTRRHIAASSPRMYAFLLQAKGSSVLSQYGHDAHLAEGDFALCDSATPHIFTVEDESRVVLLRVEAGMLKRYLPTPDQFCGLHLCSETGLTSAMSAMVDQLSTRLEAGFTSIYDERFAANVLEMLAMSYLLGFETQGDVSAIMRGRHAEVVRHIESNLRDPNLTPASIAAGLRISPRYLRTIFASSGEKVSNYVIRRRLEECAKQIRDPSWAGHSLTEIAFAWGVNSAAHFTRTFHEQFGMPPRDYRRGALS